MTLRTYESKERPFYRRSGFTLIELILTLTLSAVLIAMLLPLIGSGLKGSREALRRLPETQNLRTEMDAIWQLYRTTQPTDLPALSQAVATAATANPAPYQLIDNDWVEFDAQGVEFIPTNGAQEVLRVTIANSNGERLTSYFFPLPSP